MLIPIAEKVFRFFVYKVQGLKIIIKINIVSEQ